MRVTREWPPAAHRDRHCGWLLAVAVTGANVQDRDAGRLLLWIVRTVFPTVRLVWADSGYAGKLVDYATTTLGITVQIVAKLAGQVGFIVLPRRWCVERTFSWIRRGPRSLRAGSSFDILVLLSLKRMTDQDPSDVPATATALANRASSA
jgi:transposase